MAREYNEREVFPALLWTIIPMRQITDRRKERIYGVLSRRQPDLTLVLDNIHDPHNVSAVLRSCDAFGVGDVHLYYTSEAFPRPGRKSSASAMKWITLHKHTEADELAADLKGQGMTIAGARCSPEAKDIDRVDLTTPTAIVLGNEHRGLSPEFTPHLDVDIAIPMQGMVESLNVSVAAAIMLFEAWRQRRRQGMYDAPALDAQTFNRLFALWTQK